MEKATIFKVLGGIAVATTLFAMKKKADFTKVIENMIIKILNIRNLRLRGDKILATIDLSFENPTEFDMTILTGGLIKLKQIGLFYKGKQVGTAIATTDLNSFELPAQKSFLVKNITIELLYLNLINQWLINGLDTDVANYQVHIVLEALGKTWVVEQ